MRDLAASRRRTPIAWTIEWSWASSPSPTAARASMEPENTIPAFRPRPRAGASGIETDAWVCRRRRGRAGRTTPWSRAGSGARKSHPTRRRTSSAELRDSPAAPTSTASSAPTIELLGRREGARRRRPRLIEVGRGARRAGAAVGLLARPRAPRSCCAASPRATACQARAFRAPQARSPARSSATPSDLASAGIDAMNMHHTEWTAGLVVALPPLRRRAPSPGTRRRSAISARVLAMGIDAVYCDRPDRMVATVSEWIAD